MRAIASESLRATMGRSTTCVPMVVWWIPMCAMVLLGYPRSAASARQIAAFAIPYRSSDHDVLY